MKKEYRLQYLNDKEFEALSRVNPRYANTKDDAGFADMVTGRIFVRKSGNSLIDQFVTSHEIEEILAKNSAHEDEFNIRHKKGGVARYLVPAALAFIPGVGPALAAAANVGMNQYAQSRHPEQLGPPSIGSAVGQAATGYFGGKALSGAASGGIAGGTAAAPGFLSKATGIATGAGKGAINALGFGSPTNTTTLDVGSKITAPTMAEGFAASPAANPVGASAVKFGGANYGIAGGAGGLTAASASPFTSSLGFKSPMPSASSIQTPSTQAPTMQGGLKQQAIPGTEFSQQPEVGSGFGAKINTLSTSPGAFSGGVGGEVSQATTKTPLLQKLLGDNWRQTLIGSTIPFAGQMFAPTPEPFTPEQSALFQETANMVRQGAQVQLNPGQKQAITANYDDALEQARQNLMDRYKHLRPGSDIENDSQFRSAMIELESDFAEKKANALAGAQLGLSTQQTQMMSELAALDVQMLAMKAGISYQESADFKRMLSDMGFVVAQSGNPAYTAR